MPLIFHNVGALVADLRCRFFPPVVIGIDGWTGVGKTILARSLASELNGSAYDLDSALTRDLKAYASAIRLNEFAEAVDNANGFLFVSGVCLRDVFARTEIGVAAHVYIKRMAISGWGDEDEIVGRLPEFPGSQGQVLREEMRHYHAKWQPHLAADYEFHRPD